MTALAPGSPASNGLRQVFRNFNPFMLALWRLGLGEWINSAPEYGGRIMVLTTVGRKSGLPRRTPVNYALVGGEIYCTAGFGIISDWYRNLLKDPEVEVWLPDGWWCGIAEDISADPARLQLLREVLIASGLAAKFAGLDTQRMTDEELAKSSESYRLIRIRRTAARTGHGGPGDLAWVWPASTLLLVSAWLLRRGK